MTLREFLHLSHRFRWGGDGVCREGIIPNDCTTFCASWVREQTGVDPARDLRGLYRTGEQAAAIVAAAGGLVAFMGGRLEPMGFVRIDSPADGDIGVIVAPTGMDGDVKEVGAVRFGPLWATLGPVGIVARRADSIAAWRAPT
jgi:hypothetical protein